MLAQGGDIVNKKKPYKPAPTAIKILKALSRDMPAKSFLHGRSARGGAEWALVALRKHGFVDSNGVTAKGYEAITTINETPADGERG